MIKMRNYIVERVWYHGNKIADGYVCADFYNYNEAKVFFEKYKKGIDKGEGFVLTKYVFNNKNEVSCEIVVDTFINS